jgi:hypothetical protein
MSMKSMGLLSSRVLILALASALSGTIPATAQQSPTRVSSAVLLHRGISPPLRSIPPIQTPAAAHEIPLRPIPRSSAQGQADSVVQSTTATFVPVTSGLNFEGVGNGAYGYTVTVVPPDPNLSVGATQVVQWVNLAFAVFDKSTGTLVYGPANGNTIWQGSSLTACADNNDGDPIVQYDKAAQRWMMTQLSFTNGPPFYECIAISTTSDATGPWYRYALEWTSDSLPDYPKLGTWPDAYYMSFNMFFAGILFVGPQVCALERDKMLQDLDASVQCFNVGTGASSLLPSDLDGSTAPPAGSPNFFLGLGSNSVNLYRFHVDWVNTGNTSFAGPIGISVAGFSEACGGGTCIPQLGTTQQLDSIGDRLMYRLAYRNFGDHESLVATHSVNPGGGRRKKSGGSSAVSAVRWYEIRNPNGGPVLFQQGTYSPDTNSRWVGSIAMDKAGDIAVGYSVSSGSMYPAIRFTGRVPGDTLGTLEGESSIFEGSGSTTSQSRWGDYTSMSLDPVDDCTFWYTNEYLQTLTNRWNTRIASFKFPGCQ